MGQKRARQHVSDMSWSKRSKAWRVRGATVNAPAPLSIVAGQVRAEGTDTLDSAQEPHNLRWRTSSLLGGLLDWPLCLLHRETLTGSDISPKPPGHDGRIASGSLCCGGSRRSSSVRRGKRSAHITSHLARPPLAGTVPPCRPAVSLQKLCQWRKGCQGDQHLPGVV